MGCTDEGIWACTVYDPRPCSIETDVPEDLPFLRACHPDKPLPLPPNDLLPQSRLDDECPEDVQYGSSCEGYVPKLQCDYDHMYVGCTWDDLGCQPIVQCRCDQFGDMQWA